MATHPLSQQNSFSKIFPGENSKVNYPNSRFTQQDLPAWQPIMTPIKVVILFLIITVIFIPVGISLVQSSDSIYESKIVYDGDDSEIDCSISSPMEGRICTANFKFREDVDGPLYLYYSLTNFYQNHRRYVSSVDASQLSGEVQSEAALTTNCVDKVKKYDGRILNPCGLIANSFFTDIFTINTDNTSYPDVYLDDSEIAWDSDKDKFKQPNGFRYQEIPMASFDCSLASLPSDCKYYHDEKLDKHYLYYYPNEDTTQYLYETYPNNISPILGVTDNHFKVWMKSAALPKFRKLYAKIDHDFKKNDILSIDITANYEVESFSGSKTLILTTLNSFGGKNPYLGIAFIIVGVVTFIFGLLFSLKQLISPRKLADPSFLHWD